MKHIAVFLALLSLVGFGIASAETGPIKERQSLMKKNGDAAKLSGAMVKGEKPYDAEAAAEAMKTIHDSLDQFITLFPEGSIEGSDAKPVVLEEKADFDAKAEETKKASAAAMEAASKGLDEFRAAFIEVGQTCKGCHEKYRAEKK